MFATNRELITKKKRRQPEGVRFKNKEAQEMTYGQATVTLPRVSALSRYRWGQTCARLVAMAEASVVTPMIPLEWAGAAGKLFVVSTCM